MLVVVWCHLETVLRTKKLFAFMTKGGRTARLLAAVRHMFCLSRSPRTSRKSLTRLNSISYMKSITLYFYIRIEIIYGLSSRLPCSLDTNIR